jgi:hypothetical protein
LFLDSLEKIYSIRAAWMLDSIMVVFDCTHDLELQNCSCFDSLSVSGVFGLSMSILRLRFLETSFLGNMTFAYYSSCISFRWDFQWVAVVFESLRYSWISYWLVTCFLAGIQCNFLLVSGRNWSQMLLCICSNYVKIQNRLVSPD